MEQNQRMFAQKKELEKLSVDGTIHYTDYTEFNLRK